MDAGEAGSDARLQAAKQLQARLKLILEGELPFDIFVRWKPLSKQAIGWHPDLNDGVRMSIRPFLAQDLPGGKKGAGILRAKPNIKWEKDRGKEPVRDKAEYPWFWGWDGVAQDFAGVGKEPDGNRWNDCHYSSAAKKAAGDHRSEPVQCRGTGIAPQVDLHERDATWELVISDAVVVDPEGWLGFVVSQHVNDRVGTQLRSELALELRRIGSTLIG